MKIAITLGGGGIRGAYQIGWLKALAESKHEIVAITGSSIGALNGAVFLGGGIEKLEQLYLDLNCRYSILKHWFPPFLTAYWKKSIYSQSRLRRLFLKSCSMDILMNHNTKFACAITDMSLYDTQYVSNSFKSISKQTLISGVLASAAVPVVFPPVEIYGKQYADGAILEAIPVKKLVDLAPDADHYLIISAGKGPEKIETGSKKNIVDMLMGTISALMLENQLSDIEKGQLKYWDDRFTVINAKNDVFDNLFDVDPRKIRAAIEKSYLSAKSFLSQPDWI